MSKRKRRSFSAEFKAEAVRLCQVGDRSVGQVAKWMRELYFRIHVASDANAWMGGELGPPT